MVNLKIYKHYFTNTDCYKAAAIQEPKGVQVHSTGAHNPYLKRYVQPDDGRLGKNTNKNDHNRPGLSVCASAYIGKLQDGTLAVYETLPWNYRCWLSGSGSKGNANKKGYIGFEICEDNLNNREYFDQVVMGQSVQLTAYLCQTYKIPIENVRDHSELCKMGLASNHADISHWLKKFGLTMDDYRAAVQKVMDEGISVTYIDTNEQEVQPSMQVLYFAKVVADNNYPVKMRKSPSTSAEILVKIPVGTTVDVLEEVDKTWDKINYKGSTGYMMREFLQKIEEVIPTPDNPTDGDYISIERSTLIEMRDKLADFVEELNKLLEQHG